MFLKDFSQKHICKQFKLFGSWNMKSQQKVTFASKIGKKYTQYSELVKNAA